MNTKKSFGLNRKKFLVAKLCNTLKSNTLKTLAQFREHNTVKSFPKTGCKTEKVGIQNWWNDSGSAGNIPVWPKKCTICH